MDNGLKQSLCRDEYNNNEGAHTISADGKIIYFTACNEVMVMVVAIFIEAIKEAIFGQKRECEAKFRNLG